MANLLIADCALTDAASLTASSAAATLPVTNLQRRQPGRVWRATGKTAEHIVIDLGVAAAINLVALVNTNLSAAGTWRIRGAASEADLTAAPGYDSGALSDPSSPRGLRTQVWASFGPASYRWWRFDLADPTGPDAAIEVGRLVIDAAWQPSFNYQFGIGQGVIDPSPRLVMRGGQIDSDPQGMRNVMEALRLVGLPTDEAIVQGLARMRRTGNSLPVFVALDPADTIHRAVRSIYGLPSWDSTVLTHHNRQTLGLRVEEMPA